MFGKVKDILFSPTVREDKFDALCFNLILFDIFFVPLFPLFSVSISLPVMLYWYMKRGKKCKYVAEQRNFGVIVVLMFVSTLFSLIDFEDSSYNTDFITSFKRFVQYITSFGYFFLFLYFFINYARRINNIVFWGIVYITGYALLYTFNQEQFIYMKQTLCPFDPQVGRFLDHQLPFFRYNYLWADPNNVAYATTSLSVFYLVEERESTIKKYIVMACLAYIILCTMSFGGIGVAAAIVGYVVVFTDRLKSSKFAVLVGIIAIILIAGYVIVNFDFFYQIYDSGIAQRQDIYGDEGMAGGGGRAADFMRGLREFNPLFLCVGSGQEGFVTEIGHFYVWYMYGLPVYIYFMKVLFWKRKKLSWAEYMPILPMFVGFTMNIAIGEQKYMLLTLLISAYYYAKSYNMLHKRIVV